MTKSPPPDDGSLERVPVRVEATLPFSRDTVWAALAAPDRWWVREAVVRLTEGGDYQVRLERGWLRGKVIEADPERLLLINFPISTASVTFETDFAILLSPAAEGTRVLIEHVGPAIMAWMGERRTLEKGWRDTLVRLSNYLRGVR